jgi:hypothetical protein
MERCVVEWNEAVSDKVLVYAKTALSSVLFYPALIWVFRVSITRTGSQRVIFYLVVIRASRLYLVRDVASGSSRPAEAFG